MHDVFDKLSARYQGRFTKGKEVHIQRFSFRTAYEEGFLEDLGITVNEVFHDRYERKQQEREAESDVSITIGAPQ